MVKEYDYHAPNEALPRCQKCVKYEYDSECPDKLTKFDGNEIEYDSIGCPTKYKGENYEWKNGKLSKIHRSTFYSGDEHYATRTFTYDGYGRRTQVQFVSGVNFAGANAVSNYSKSSTHNYNYDNSGRLIRESYTATDFSGTVHETRELVYLYDESGMIGVMLNSQPYYYHRNLQGDVIAIYDANGNKQVEYAYDAWGNCEVVYADNDKIAYANPIRYRGYYYDKDTKLYYLNARYYSPEWRRFISPDAAEYVDPETPNGLNLYAYCYNDPVNYADTSGHFVITLSAILWAAAIGGVLGAASGAIYGGLTAVANDQDVWEGVGIGALTGGFMGAGAGVASLFIAPIIVGESVAIATAAGGMAVSTGASLTIGIGIGFGTGVFGGASSDMLTQIANNGKISDWGSTSVSALQWGVINTTSAFLGALGGPLSNLESGFVTGVFNNVTGIIGLAIDVIRGVSNKRKNLGYLSYSYGY